MINKKENQEIDSIIYKNAKNIYHLILHKDIKTAYVKFETIRQMAEIFDKVELLKEEIIYLLLKNFSAENVDLFFRCFEVNFTDYRKNDYGITDYEVLEKGSEK